MKIGKQCESLVNLYGHGEQLFQLPFPANTPKQCRVEVQVGNSQSVSPTGLKGPLQQCTCFKPKPLQDWISQAGTWYSPKGGRSGPLLPSLPLP